MLGGSSPEPTSCTRMAQSVVLVPEEKPRPVCMELAKGSERGGRRPWPPRPSEYTSFPAHCCHLRPLALDSDSHRALAASRLHRPSFSSTWPFPMGHKKIGCFYWEEEGDPRLASPPTCCTWQDMHEACAFSHGLGTQHRGVVSPGFWTAPTRPCFRGHHLRLHSGSHC